MREQRDAARAERDEIRDRAKAAPRPGRTARRAPGPSSSPRWYGTAPSATRACGSWPRAPWWSLVLVIIVLILLSL